MRPTYALRIEYSTLTETPPRSSRTLTKTPDADVAHPTNRNGPTKHKHLKQTPAYNLYYRNCRALYARTHLNMHTLAHTSLRMRSRSTKPLARPHKTASTSHRCVDIERHPPSKSTKDKARAHWMPKALNSMPSKARGRPPPLSTLPRQQCNM